jgi:hypothetical protein
MMIMMTDDEDAGVGDHVTYSLTEEKSVAEECA